MKNKLLSKLLVCMMLTSTLFSAPCTQVFAEGLSAVGDTSSSTTTVTIEKESPVNVVVTIPSDVTLNKTVLPANEDDWKDHLDGGIDFSSVGADMTYWCPYSLQDINGLFYYDSFNTNISPITGMLGYDMKINTYYDCVDTVTIEGVPADINGDTPVCKVTLASNNFTLTGTNSGDTINGVCDFVWTSYGDYDNTAMDSRTGESMITSTSLEAQSYPVLFAYQGTAKVNETYTGTVTFNVELYAK